MKTLEIALASKPLYEYAKELRDDIIVLTSDNEPIAAVVSLKNLDSVDLEWLSLSTNPEFMEIIDKSRKELRSGKKLSLEEMEREFQLAE
jgi:PHD/YefM family antitoxin component YafN of YafNO toxin-antitoxin module